MKPIAAKAGDTIALVSPASSIDEEKSQAGIELLRSRGYQVKLGAHAYDRLGYLAGRDEDRASDLMQAFGDREVAAVVCMRGGYGCSRLLPHLDLDLIASSGKLFAGFSDVTVLHLALNRRGLPTLHAPMMVSFSKPKQPWSIESFFSALEGRASVPVEAPRGHTVVGGSAEGIVVGGCLTLLADSLGTAESFSGRGKIVLMEDVGEDDYRVDASLTHLLNAGALEGVAGIVVGEMTETDEKKREDRAIVPWREIVCERLEPLGVPLIVGYPFGHLQDMLSLPLGIRAQMDADEGTLEYLEPLCVAAD